VRLPKGSLVLSGVLSEQSNYFNLLFTKRLRGEATKRTEKRQNNEKKTNKAHLNNPPTLFTCHLLANIYLPLTLMSQEEGDANEGKERCDVGD